MSQLATDGVNVRNSHCQRRSRDITATQGVAPPPFDNAMAQAYMQMVQCPMEVLTFFFEHVQDVSEVPYRSHIDEWHIKENHDFSMFSYGYQKQLAVSIPWHQLKTNCQVHSARASTSPRLQWLQFSNSVPRRKLLAGMIFRENSGTQTTNFFGGSILVFRCTVMYVYISSSFWLESQIITDT